MGFLNQVFGTKNSSAKFMRACFQGDYSTVRKLVQKNPSLVHYKAIDGDGNDVLTGVMQAAEHGHRYIVQFLLQKGASPNYTGKGDPTKSTAHPLIYACFNSRLDTVRALLQGGADINAVSAFGTPLELLALRHRIEPPDAWLLFEYAHKNNAPIRLRSVSEMRAQHDGKDIAAIQKGLTVIRDTIRNVAAAAKQTFHSNNQAFKTPSSSKQRKRKPSTTKKRRTKS